VTLPLPAVWLSWKSTTLLVETFNKVCTTVAALLHTRPFLHIMLFCWVAGLLTHFSKKQCELISRSLLLEIRTDLLAEHVNRCGCRNMRALDLQLASVPSW
jgi:hypothetical protein